VYSVAHAVPSVISTRISALQHELGSLAVLLPPVRQVLREGEWSEAVGAALQHLGCWLLDDSVIDFACPALDRCMHQPTAPGVLAALVAAMQRDPAAFAAAMLSMQPLQRRHLRAYMLQAKWFAGGCLAQRLLRWFLVRLHHWKIR
jgi:hypothetical protein